MYKMAQIISIMMIVMRVTCYMAMIVTTMIMILLAVHLIN